jgi:hypothetical protein
MMLLHFALRTPIGTSGTGAHPVMRIGWILALIAAGVGWSNSTDSARVHSRQSGRKPVLSPRTRGAPAAWGSTRGNERRAEWVRRESLLSTEFRHSQGCRLMLNSRRAASEPCNHSHRMQRERNVKTIVPVMVFGLLFGVGTTPLANAATFDSATLNLYILRSCPDFPPCGPDYNPGFNRIVLFESAVKGGSDPIFSDSLWTIYASGSTLTTIFNQDTFFTFPGPPTELFQIHLTIPSDAGFYMTGCSRPTSFKNLGCGSLDMSVSFVHGFKAGFRDDVIATLVDGVAPEALLTPEPNTCAMFGLGLLIIAWVRFRIARAAYGAR